MKKELIRDDVAADVFAKYVCDNFYKNADYYDFDETIEAMDEVYNLNISSEYENILSNAFYKREIQGFMLGFKKAAELLSDEYMQCINELNEISMGGTVQYNYDTLKNKIIEKYKLYEAFADDLGIGYYSLLSRLNNETTFSMPEITKTVELLELTPNEIGQCFYDRMN